jgi:PAS domain S-box-containing protein
MTNLHQDSRVRTVKTPGVEISRLLLLQSEISSALLSSHPSQDVLSRCTECIVKHLGAAFARIWTVNAAGDVLELQASAGIYTNLDGTHSQIPVGQFKIGLIAQERRPHLTNKVIGDSRVHNQEWARKEKMVAFAGYPLLIEDRLVGVLGMFSRKKLPKTTLLALGSIANSIALGIERKNSEKALRESEEFSRRVIESSSDCVKILDLDFHLQYMSPVAMKLMEVDDFGTCRNADWTSFWRDGDRPQVMAAIQQALDGGVGNFHAFCPTMKGTPKWWDVTVTPIRGSDGTVVKLLSSSRDVTKKKETEHELVKSRQDLELRVAQRTQALQREVEERQKAENELRKLSGKLLNLRDSEQRRIARELHDSVGQLLVATTMTLASVSDCAKDIGPEAAEALAKAEELLQETIKEVRVVSHLLHPPLLDETGLPSAIRWYLEGFSQRGHIQTEVIIPEDFGRLPVELETAIFRVVQECLTNIHRHSGSKTATVRISRIADELRVSVEDQGKGMPVHPFRGVGLRGMKERLTQFGGTLEVRSTKAGTTVLASLPSISSAIEEVRRTTAV